ncbi:MAG: carboxymuconolactone decarboxylase family protein [Bacteroidales bacterium]|nr:carboxymuconolactone decarboxylase family protein [Bacteroidales bacterium]
MKQLNKKQQMIVLISAFTAKSDVGNLKTALNEGLDSGLTINEIKEELNHLYAYCGFAPSIRGLMTFRDVLKERQTEGINDEVGRDASPIDNNSSKYERGEKAQVLVTGQTAEQLKTNFDGLSPLMDVLLKEHLFADLFGRDILTFIERELTTVSALASMHEPMVQSHFHGALNVGVTEQQLRELLSIVEESIGKAEAETGRTILNGVLASRENE